MKVTKYFWNGAEIRWESGVGSNIKQFLLRTSGVYTVQQVLVLNWFIWIGRKKILSICFISFAGGIFISSLGNIYSGYSRGENCFMKTFSNFSNFNLNNSSKEIPLQMEWK